MCDNKCPAVTRSSPLLESAGNIVVLAIGTVATATAIAELDGHWSPYF